MMEGIIVTSYSQGDKFYIDPAKLLPLARFLQEPKFTLCTWATTMAMIPSSPLKAMSNSSPLSSLSDPLSYNEDEAKQAILYSYSRSFSGFAAIINSTQASTLASMEEVIAVFRSKALKLHTTRSWDFMGLTLGGSGEYSTPMHLEYGDDVIVGLFNTGVWPESDSFSKDTGMGPSPPCWRGTSVNGDQFDLAICNNKFIGARYYLKGYEQQFGPLDTTYNAEYQSPRDRVGHGSHTASTVAGSALEHVSYLGQLGHGTARGGAPRARLAVYKICWSTDLQGVCTEADKLAAFDDALRDGVPVISASIGYPPPLRQFSLSSNIGLFHAMQLGVTIVFSAGNDGPESSTVENVTPRSICVGADWSFPARILLGNNQLLTVNLETHYINICMHVN